MWCKDVERWVWSSSQIFWGKNSNVNLIKHSQCYWITGKASTVIVVVVFFLLHLWKVKHGVLDIYNCVEPPENGKGNWKSCSIHCAVSNTLLAADQSAHWPPTSSCSLPLAEMCQNFFFFFVSFPCLPVEGGISLGNVLHSWQLESSCQVRLPHSVLRPLSYSVVDQQIALRET